MGIGRCRPCFKGRQRYVTRNHIANSSSKAGPDGSKNRRPTAASWRGSKRPPGPKAPPPNPNTTRPLAASARGTMTAPDSIASTAFALAPAMRLRPVPEAIAATPRAGVHETRCQALVGAAMPRVAMTPVAMAPAASAPVAVQRRAVPRRAMTPRATAPTRASRRLRVHAASRCSAASIAISRAKTRPSPSHGRRCLSRWLRSPSCGGDADNPESAPSRHRAGLVGQRRASTIFPMWSAR